MAKAFAEAGSHLALLDSNASGLEEVAQPLRSAWTGVQTEVADLGTRQGVHDGIHAVLAPYHHQIDILVANVGVLIAGPFADMTDAQIEDGLTMNFLTHVWACQDVLPLMQGRPGANIVLIGSDQGSQPDKELFPYAPAKAALHNLTKLLAREYGPEIRVNCVAPGMSRTPFIEGLIDKLARDDFQTDRATVETLEIQRRGVPLQRLGKPEEIAEAAVFLAHNQFATGTIFDLSGGNVRGL